MVGALAQQLGRLVEDCGALLDVDRAPFGPGALRSGERFVEVGRGRIRHVGDPLGGDRVDDGVGVAAFAGTSSAVDEQLEVGFDSPWRASTPALKRVATPR